MKALRLLIIGGFVLLLPTAWRLTSPGRFREQPRIHYVARPGDLRIHVQQSGTLESQRATTLVCEVENISEGRRTFDSQIIFLVPNGRRMKQGELLVELDSSGWREKIDIKQLAVAKCVAQRIAADISVDNQRLKNETALKQAKLQLELAELELRMYMDQDNGTMQLAREELDRKVEDVENQIREAEAAAELLKTEKLAIEELHQLGHRAANEVRQSRLRLLQANNRLVAHSNQLSSYEAERENLETHQQQMQMLQLRSAVATARRNIQQVKHDNAAALIKLKAYRDERLKAEKKHQGKLERFQRQLDLCRIYAPHDGIVVHARQEQGEPLAEGIQVRRLQPLITMPDLSRMQVRLAVEEGVLDLVQPGLPATVRVHARPDELYHGVVHYVASIASAGEAYNSSGKRYEVMIRIADDAQGLIPGMSAAVEIHVEHLRDVLSIPVQAVEASQQDPWCFVETTRDIERRVLQLGPSNGKFVHVRQGLVAGDRVVLNPMSIPDHPGETVGRDTRRAN